MKSILCFIVIFCFFFSLAYGEYTKVTHENYVSEADIYLDENGNTYSTIINIKFTKNIIDLPKNIISAKINKISNLQIKSHFSNLEKKYGKIDIIKSIPSSFWGDTLRINKRTGQQVVVPDLSQHFKIKFSNLVPVDELIRNLKKLPFIEHVVGPEEAILTLDPNDYYFLTDPRQWSLESIQASDAWNITTGNNSIVICINDKFTSAMTTLHPDVVNKVNYHYNWSLCGNHGLSVSGFAGAQTNNSLGVASLGWNISLMYTQWGSAGIIYSVDNGADVINFSYINPSYYEYNDEISYALAQGVVCVASAGNDYVNLGYTNPPQVRYPAAYSFGTNGQVIAVTATIMNSGVEEFIDGWNYSVGNDPINDPINSFVDVSAPGGRVWGFDLYTYNSYRWLWGTSFSAPQVSALAGLLLSIDDSLTPVEIYNIITGTADKIGQYTYNAIGWNRYMGYGRINAYTAVNVLNSSPSAPQSLNITNSGQNGQNINISWTANTEADLDHYAIYRGTRYSKSDPIYWGSNPCATTTNTNWTDPDFIIDLYGSLWVYYRVKAVDYIDNESDYSIWVNTKCDVLFKDHPDSTNQEISFLPKKFDVYSNFPNPFNPETTIRYELPSDSYVTLKIYDINGKLINTLLNGLQSAGYKTVSWNASNCSSGIYIYQLFIQNDGKNVLNKSGKMMVVK